MRNKALYCFLLASTLLSFGLRSDAEGISVDAGLTPAQDRIIFRIQYRNITNHMAGNDIMVHMSPLVVAYGLTPDITLMMRNNYRRVGKNETMREINNRWMDPFLMGKVKLYRLNTRNYSFGVAGFAGTTFPILSSSASKTYSPVIGVNASFRPGLWSFDLNNAFEWVNYNSEDNREEAKQLQINLAISRNIFLPKWENWILSPVQEFSLVNNKPTSGKSDLAGFISPGIQVVSPHLKIEVLYQVAVNSSTASQMEFGNRLILGMRLML